MDRYDYLPSEPFLHRMRVDPSRARRSAPCPRQPTAIICASLVSSNEGGNGRGEQHFSVGLQPAAVLGGVLDDAGGVVDDLLTFFVLVWARLCRHVRPFGPALQRYGGACARWSGRHCASPPRVRPTAGPLWQRLIRPLPREFPGVLSDSAFRPRFRPSPAEQLQPDRGSLLGYPTTVEGRRPADRRPSSPALGPSVAAPTRNGRACGRTRRLRLGGAVSAEPQGDGSNERTRRSSFVQLAHWTQQANSVIPSYGRAACVG